MVRSIAVGTLLAAATMIGAPPVAAAGVPHHRARSHHVRAVAAPRHAAACYGYGYGYCGGNIAPVDPSFGYSEAPFDPSYNGPGADVLAATHYANQNATLLHEIAPDAKVSATGTVVGGF